MRKSVKRGIVAAAIAASALGAGAGIAASAAGPASAATTAAVVTHQAPVLNNWHQMNLVYNGTTYTGYWVLLYSHRDGLLTGWLYDPNLPSGQRYMAVHGVVNGSVVQFNATYPAGDPQGSRGFIGVIGTGAFSGVWNETGSEAGTGTFTFV
jgi:hypothetical protein